jgi:transposase
MFELEDYYMLQEQALEPEELYGKVNISALSRETGYDRKTIRKYLSADTQPPEQQHRKKPSKLDPYKDYLLKRLSDYPLLSCATLLEEIQLMGYTGKRTILGDYLHSHRPHPVPLPEWRYETKPGVQSQIDWADCKYTLSTGIIRKVSCFTMILGYSRMRYVEFTRSTDLVTFLLCLQKAFEYFGGVTEQILFDNIKTVVLKRKYPSSESDFHPVFMDFRDHYGFKARLCRS